MSFVALEKYQKDVKEKLARQKARLADTKEKVKKKMVERKIHRAEVRSQSEVRDLNSEGGRRNPARRGLRPGGKSQK